MDASEEQERGFLIPTPQQPLLYYQTPRRSSRQRQDRLSLDRGAAAGSSRPMARVQLSGSVQGDGADSRSPLDGVTFRITRRWQFTLTSVMVNVILSVLLVIAQVGAAITFLLYAHSLERPTVTNCGQTQRTTGDVYFATVFTTLWLTVIFGAFVGVARLLNRDFAVRCHTPQRDLIALGLLNSFSTLLLAYSDRYGRTPSYLQQLISVTIIPMAVIFRFAILRKSISYERIMCAVCIAIAAIISIAPVALDLHGDSPGLQLSSGAKTNEWKAIWSVLFWVGILFAALFVVLEEKVLQTPTIAPSQNRRTSTNSKTKDANTLVLVAWIQLWSLCFLVLLFFTDFVPSFGRAMNVQEFGYQIRDGFKCMFGTAPTSQNITGNCSHVTEYHSENVAMPTVIYSSPDPHCHVPIMRGWLFIIFSGMASLVNVLLIKYSEGANFAVVVQTLAIPMVAIFWTLFRLDPPSDLSWHPVFNTPTIFVIVGFCAMVPGVFFFNRFWRKEVSTNT